jgi:hypothetical protein
MFLEPPHACLNALLQFRYGQTLEDEDTSRKVFCEETRIRRGMTVGTVVFDVNHRRSPPAFPFRN